MKRIVSALLLVWVTFCVLLFHWIGLLGEAFGYDANDLVYLKLAVLLWIGHGLTSGAVMTVRGAGVCSRIPVVWHCLIGSVLIFDAILLFGGRPVNLWFIALPTVHAVGVLGLWRTGFMRD
jgi:hypothetical protein